ncbi:MAG: cytochrome c oxidase assembly protein [Litorilinea sp.]
MPNLSEFEMPHVSQLLAAGLLAAWVALYVGAWYRRHRAQMRLASVFRLVCFGLGSLLLFLALVGPVPHWADSLLTGRSIQKALLAMLAPPLLWLGLPYHIIARSLPAQIRRRIRLGPLTRRLTHPLAAWLLFISIFLLWHDPAWVNWTMDSPGLRAAGSWLLLGSALLFWWHVINTGPRLHTRLPGWIMAIYLLFVEIPNMAAGITIAFTMQPMYAAYAALHTANAGLPFDYASDQMISGAIIWVFGSMVYISAIIGILYRLFRREGSNSPRPLVGWDDADKVIAPGLEHRLERDAPNPPWQRANGMRP